MSDTTLSPTPEAPASASPTSRLSATQQTLLEERLKRRRSAGSAMQSIPRRREEGPAPLSYGQERLWFLHQIDGGAAYNMPTAIQWNGSLSVPALAAALEEIVRRHEMLRTRFETRDDGARAVQVVDPWSPRPLALADLSGLPVPSRHAERKRLIDANTTRGFDLARGPILRYALLRLGRASTDSGEEHVLLTNVHHIASDGWSQGIYFNELVALYEAAVKGRPSPLPELPIQYGDFAAWQRDWLRGPNLEAQLAYWKRQLGGAPAVLELPADRPRPAIQTFRGDTEAFAIDKATNDALKALGRQEGVSLFMALLATFSALLGRYSGQEDLTMGTPLAGRVRMETERLIGLFTNTLVLRSRLDGDPTFRQLLARASEVALEAFAHQDVPFEKLVEELSPERSLAHTPLFQVMLILQNAPTGTVALGDLALRPLLGFTPTAKFDLTLICVEKEGALKVRLEYSSDLFDRATAARMASHLAAMLAAGIAVPDTRLSELPLLTPAERGQLAGWNATAAEYPRELTAHRLVELEAERRPEAVAVVLEPGMAAWMGEARELTYCELDRRANRLARRLAELGVGPEVLVGLAVERGPAMLVGLLAVLKAGGAYVPLDPAQPRERLAAILEDARPAVLVTEQAVAPALPETEVPLLSLDAEWPRVAQMPDGPLAAGAEPESLAYTIFTSGSTGRPKGVQIPHRALVNFLLSMRREPGFGPGDVLVAVTTLAFDISGLELLLPLVAGGRVAIAGRETAADAALLAARLAAAGATVLQATPATWRMLLDAGWEGDRRLRALCGGEALPAELAERLLPRVGELWNVYGPTETTIWSAARRVEPGEAPVRVGGPIANTGLWIVDRNLQPLPVGVPGELAIGGDGLARGYLGRPDLTASQFVPDPFGGDAGARLYRTGDLARRRPDGDLQFLGRVDHQVKLRGFRIELGEIEAALARSPGVAQAVVAAREDAPGEMRLVAYVVPAPGEAVDVAALRSALRERLPEYMVPAAFVPMESLPLNANGKVDRKALPAPEGMEAPAVAVYVPPSTAVEELLVEIWSEVLRRDGIGITDNFFDLGGHSLLATQVAARVRSMLQLEMPLRSLFQAPTIEQLARTVEDLLLADADPGV